MPPENPPGAAEPAAQPFALDASKLPDVPVTTTENERLLSALAYLSQVALPLVMPILLLANRNTRSSGFVRQHATQAIGLVVAGVVYYLLALLALLLVRSNAQVLVIGLALLMLPPIGVSLLYAVRALQGRWTEVPWLTNFLKDTGLL